MKRAAKVRMCGCGHEQGHHVVHGGKASGRCFYGAGTITGGCECTGFHTHRRGSPVRSAPRPVTSPHSKTLAALDRAEAAIREAREALLESGRGWADTPGPKTVEVGRSPTELRVVGRVSGRPLLGRRGAEPKERPAVEAGEIGKGTIRVLTAIAQHGAQGVTRVQLTALTGYKRSTRDAYVQRLVNAQYADIQYGRIVARQAGLDRLGHGFERLPTGSALLKHWMQNLPAGECLVLEVLARAWPSSVLREKISDATGFARSTRDAYVQRLRARELVVTTRSTVVASSMLFDRVAATS